MPGVAVIRRRSQLSRRDEEGAVAVTVALCLTALCVVAAMVLDFGLIKVDRQVNKSAADSAVLAGLHAMDFTGSSTARPFVGVCAALRFLKANDRRFEGLSEGSGWQDGNGTAVPGNGCSDLTRQAQTCSRNNKTTWARYEAAATYNGLSFTVRIKNGYDFDDVKHFDSSGHEVWDWPEDSLSATSGDRATDPCMDMELTISETRRPGLGSLATSSDLSTGIRTVGRVNPGPGGYAPAMLLLKRTGCDPNPVSIGGSGTFIHVLGFASTSGVSQPGTIHSDNDGGGNCANNGGKQILNGNNVSNGIVAYAAPAGPASTVPDPSKPGQITSVAGTLAVPLDKIRSSNSEVYGASGVSEAAPGAHAEPQGRSLVSRQPVDARYMSTVKTIASNSLPYFSLGFATKAAANGAGWGYASCSPSGEITASTLDIYSASFQGLYVNCSQVTKVPGVLSNWKTVVFSGSLKTTGGNSIVIPDATKVYITGSTSGAATTISGTGASFQVHTTGRTEPVATTVLPDGQRCVPTKTNDRALLVIANGALTDNELFRACDTTVVLLGGALNPATIGCIPNYDPLAEGAIGPSPSSSPCPGPTSGTGGLSVNGNADWTAPNNCATITRTSCDGVPADVTAGWGNVNGPEDLAFWSESAAAGTNARIGGSAAFNLRGVFMTPNFDPLIVGGGPNTNLTNAQFVSSALSLNGGAQLTMSVDPDAAVTLPKLGLVGLVR